MSTNKVDQVLLIDVGNTNLKWSLAGPAGIGSLERVCHLDLDVGDLLSHALEGVSPCRVMIASVMGDEMGAALCSWFEKSWCVSPEMIQPSSQCLGVTNAYTQPEQLGVDRWLTLLAVHLRSPRASCIVDCGTAITIDVLKADGVHLGGMILPGLDLMREGLLSRTRIPRVVDTPVGKLLAHDTATAVASAAINSAAALVERTLSQIGAELGTPLTLICTGNDAEKLMELIDYPAMLQRDLVMQGLFELAREGMAL